MGVPQPDADENVELLEWRDFGNALARRFYEAMGCIVAEGYRFDEATHPQERLCWHLAVIACEEYDGTDLQDIVDEIEE